MKICGVDDYVFEEYIDDMKVYEHNILDHLYIGGGCDEGYSCEFCCHEYSTLSSGCCVYCALCGSVCCPDCAYLANSFEDLNVNNYHKNRNTEMIEECRKKIIKKDCDEKTVIECVNYLGNNYCCPLCFKSANPDKYISTITIFNEIEKHHPGLIKDIVKDKTLITSHLGQRKDVIEFLNRVHIKFGYYKEKG